MQPNQMIELAERLRIRAQSLMDESGRPSCFERCATLLDLADELEKMGNEEELKCLMHYGD